MTIIDVLLIVLILSAIVLCIFTITFLKRLGENVELLRKDVDQVVQKTIPVLEKLDNAADKLNNMTTEIDGYVTEIGGSYKDLKSKIESVFKPSAHKGDGNPIGNLIQNLSAISKGIRAFFVNLRSPNT